MLADLDDMDGGDICRVCRSEGSADRPLFHPCICTGSIKWIHQECLVQWMRYSKKEYCELCRYKFSFTPIYDPDMPRRLPVSDLVAGLAGSLMTGFKYWIHYTIVVLAWLGIVPLIACRTFRSLFSGSFDSVISLPLVMFSLDDIPSDIFHGSFIVTCTLVAFIGLVWLREQIISGGGPDWLEIDENDFPPRNMIADPARNVQVENNEQQPQQEQENDEDRVQNANGAGAVDEHNNWNPVEWDRAGEELTWERLLGLDGSLVFLEHVFWVISLNALFALVFAFFPHMVGYYLLLCTDTQDYATASQFEGLVTTFVGYLMICMMLLVLYFISGFTNFGKIRRAIGLSYVVVKVTLLLVIEIGALPLICGWWLDICSLGTFDVTLQDREDSFVMAPGTCMFIHWLVGMVFVYYFATFILLLREVLRPGVLWFLRNLNDPDFSPIQEMINLPMLRHIRRLMASAVIFGVTVMLVVWIPEKILKYLWPSFLPFVVSNHSESVNELSLELLLLQIILPALLEHSYIRNWMKSFLRQWCRAVSWCLDLKSYLLGNEENLQQQNQRQAANQENPAPPLGGGLGAAHQALLQRGGPTGFQPYVRPKYFYLRIWMLLFCVAISLVTASLILLTVPVYMGRNIMSLWPSGNASKSEPLKIHELYTASVGTYCLWILARSISLGLKWVPKGKAVLAKRIWISVVVILKSLVISFWLFGVIPLLLGFFAELVLLIPLRVDLNQTPVFWAWQDWALGVLYAKIGAALVLMGPDWKFRRGIDRMFRHGLRRLNVLLMMKDVIIPTIATLALSLSIPYAVAYSMVPLFVRNFHIRNLIARRIYPFLLFTTGFFIVLSFQVKQFIKLYEHIKNDKYLVGKRLVNYNHRLI